MLQLHLQYDSHTFAGHGKTRHEQLAASHTSPLHMRQNHCPKDIVCQRQVTTSSVLCQGKENQRAAQTESSTDSCTAVRCQSDRGHKRSREIHLQPTCMSCQHTEHSLVAASSCPSHNICTMSDMRLILSPSENNSSPTMYQRLDIRKLFKFTDIGWFGIRNITWFVTGSLNMIFSILLLKS